MCTGKPLSWAIEEALLLQLARATRHLRAAWSFTPFPMGPQNQAAVLPWLGLRRQPGLVQSALLVPIRELRRPVLQVRPHQVAEGADLLLGIELGA